MLRLSRSGAGHRSLTPRLAPLRDAGCGGPPIERAVDEEEVRRRVLEEVTDLATLAPLERRLRVASVADRHLGGDLGSDRRAGVLAALVDDIAGLGPLEPLLADGAVTEIMVNGPEDVFVEVGGELRASPVRFRDADHLLSVVHRLLRGTGRRVDEGAPMVDARMADGSRLNVVLPPVSLSSAVLTIRRPPRRRLDLARLIELGALDAVVAAFLHAAVLGRCNLVVSGGAGTGKSTLLGALCALVPEGQRILLLEDVAELALHHPHVVAQQCRPAAPDGTREVTLRDLVRNSLRMRPDRLVVGEVRGPEAADMLSAMNTGHAGSMTTLHANSAEDALTRLETMLAVALPAVASGTLRSWMAASIDVVVHCDRGPHGQRRVGEVAAVDAGAARGPRLLSVYARDGHGPLRPAGEIPHRCLDRMSRHGVRFPVRLLARSGAA
jgi:pilus assembly protein CpaF